MMGLGKPKVRTKFEVAGFVCYGNIRKLVSKIWDKPKWGTPYYLEKLNLDLLLDSQSQCFLFDVQLLWSYDYSKWAIFTKNRILQQKILNFGSCKVGVENFCTKLPKTHPHAKSGRTNRLAYVAVTLFRHYTATRKKYVRMVIGNSMSSITLRLDFHNLACNPDYG